MREEPLAELRRFDHDRYLTCLFAPQSRRRRLVALYAFNLEIAKTAEVVQEPMIGRIRLQWWREALSGTYQGQIRSHAVVEALAKTIADCDLAEARLQGLIDAREFDLEQRAPKDLAELEGYARASSSALVGLALQVLGCDGPEGRGVGDAVGLSWALTGLLRAIPVHARQKRLFLPEDMTSAAGLDLGKLFALQSSRALKDLVAEIARIAEGQLASARANRRLVPKQGLAALLPATLAGNYLKILKRAGYDPFDPAVQQRPPGRAWRLALASRLGRF
jgi:phytoene synthase